jgi:hypothetical protein
MSEYEVGYRKPPKNSRFKKGASPNPKGRPKRKLLAVGDVFDNVLDAPAEYREGGKTKRATRRELTLRNFVRLALSGDVKAAETLLKLRAHAQRFGDARVNRVEVKDWLPDYPGQTASKRPANSQHGVKPRPRSGGNRLTLIRPTT